MTPSRLARAAVGRRELRDGSVGAGQLAGGSVGRAQLRPGAVGPGNLDNASVGAPQIQGGSVGSEQLAPGAVGQRELKPGTASPRLFAHVNSTGTLQENAGVTSAARTGTGQYNVDFDRPLNGCVAVATVGFGFGSGVIGAGATAQARMNRDNQASRVGVTIYRKGYTFADVEDNDFHLIVMC